MSFGQHQYQHRFYNQATYKIPQLYSSPMVIMVPKHTSQVQTMKHSNNLTERVLPPSNINVKVQTGNAKRSDPSYEEGKVASYVTDVYAQEYVANGLMLERFRMEAYLHKRRNRHVNNMDAGYNNPSCNNSLTVRHPTEQKQQTNQQACNMTISQVSQPPNPELNLQLSGYDLGIIVARLDHLQRDTIANTSKIHLDRQILMFMERKRKKKKYVRLSQRLKSQAYQLKLRQQMEIANRQQENKQINDLQIVITEMNEQLLINSQMLKEVMRQNEDFRIRKLVKISNPPLPPPPPRIIEPPIPIAEEFNIHIKKIYTHTMPKVVYHTPALPNQYHPMKKLEQQPHFISQNNKHHTIQY